MDLPQVMLGVLMAYLLWNQNRILARQGPAKPGSGWGERMSGLRRYWPLLAMIILTLLVWMPRLWPMIVPPRELPPQPSSVRLTRLPTESGVLFTNRQIGELANFLNEKCKLANCQKPEVLVAWRPLPDSLERAFELRSVFQHAFWSVSPFSGPPPTPATVTDNLWWDREFNGPGVHFLFPDGDLVAQLFYEKLHSIAPSIQKASCDKGWTFYVVGENEQ
jgi:hypothetical protein